MREIRSSIIITLICLWLCPGAMFANFGESCSGLPAGPANNYLKIDTPHGHLIGNIDMTTFVTGACDPTTNELKFCLQMPAGVTPRCSDPITIPVGNSKKLSELSSSPELGGNSLLKDLVMTFARLDDYICRTMPTSRGQLPIACKCMHVTTSLVAPPVVDVDPACRPIGDSCYDGHKKSQSPLNFSGTAVFCLT